MTFAELEKKIRPFAKDFDKKISIIFKSKEKIILGLNRSQLIIEGINIEGHDLPEYKPVTVKLRKAEGLQTNYMDLSFSGAFQKEMFIEWDTKGFTIESQNYKETELNKRYNQVLGLTDENLEGLILNQILPILINKMF